MKIESQNISAILWMMLTGFIAMTINTIARYVSPDMHAFQIVFFYNIIGLLFFAPYVLYKKTPLNPKNAKLLALRGVFEFVGFSAFFYALSKNAFPTVTAIGFTAPLFGVIAAVILLKEKSCRKRWIALLVGFLGVLVITRPGINGTDPSVFFVLLSSLMFAMCGILIKKLTESEPNERIVFYMLLTTAIISFPFALSVWRAPSTQAIYLIILMGVLVAAVQFCVTQAISKANVSIVQPIFFLNLVWASIYSYIIFNELIDVWTVAGAVIIIASAAYNTKIAHSEEKEQEERIIEIEVEAASSGM